MKTVELSAALGQAQVVENLKNFVGVDAQGAAALMTPERLAAVAGGFVTVKGEKDLNKYTAPGTYYINFWSGDFLNAPYNDCFAILEVRKHVNILFQRISSEKGVLSRMGEIDKLPSWPAL